MHRFLQVYQDLVSQLHQAVFFLLDQDVEDLQHHPEERKLDEHLNF
jgi:hypothetical protein